MKIRKLFNTLLKVHGVFVKNASYINIKSLLFFLFLFEVKCKRTCQKTLDKNISSVAYRVRP